MVFEDEVDNEDKLIEYVLSHRLNQSFEFVSLGNEIPVKHPLQWNLAGPHTVVSITEFSLLLQYFKFGTVDQLLMISEIHHIPFSSLSKKIAKNTILNTMFSHSFSQSCKDIKYIF